MPIFNFNQNGQVVIPLPMPVENGGTGAEDAATARANLGLDSIVDLNSNQTINGNKSFTNAIAASSGNFAGNSTSSGLEVQSVYPNSAYMRFHIGSQIIFHFGVDAEDAALKLGGGSFGNSKFRMWHEAYGVPVWQTPSDKRLKNSIKPIESALELILKSNPVKFRYTAKIRSQGLFGNLQERYKPHYGFIAQDFPIEGLITEKDSGEKGINYLEIVPFLVKAIQELQEQIDVLKKVTN